MAIDTTPSMEVRRKLTSDDMERMLLRGELEDGNHELIDGELIDVGAAGDDHGRTTIDLILALGNFARGAGGQVWGSVTGFRVGRDFTQVRAPDIAYTGPGRVPARVEGYLHGAPELAVEVLSHDQHGEACAVTKVREYFEAGGIFVWLVDRRRREVRVYRRDSDDYVVLRGDAVLTLEPIIEGFSLRVADIFH